MKVPCPLCTQELLYDPNLAGKTVACSYCKRPLLIPSLQQLPVEYQQEYREEQDQLRKKQDAQKKKLEEQRVQESQREERERLQQKHLEEVAWQQLKQSLYEEGKAAEQRGGALVLQASQHTPEDDLVSNSYPGLRSIAAIYGVAAVIAIVVGLIACVVVLGVNEGSPAAWGAAALIAASVTGTVLFFVLVAESIKLFLNMADDIRVSKALLKRVAYRQDIQPPE
jgi:hypothetical protein